MIKVEQGPNGTIPFCQLDPGNLFYDSDGDLCLKIAPDGYLFIFDYDEIGYAKDISPNEDSFVRAPAGTRLIFEQT